VHAAVLGVVADDRRAAGALEGAATRHSFLERSLLVRSARVVAQRLVAHGDQLRDRNRAVPAGTPATYEEGGHGRAR
jgi:hypothetical protein